jgi:phosphoribosylamine---glycine ligase
VPIFGPNKSAAQIEASKVFSKDLMLKYKVPSAQSVSFSDFASAREYVIKKGPPLVIKADGLAGGKGVTVADSLRVALEALADIMVAKAYGPAGNRVIVEEKLAGKEMSFFVFTDGKTIVPMVPACDYKRACDGDLGPNTGGMGSYSPPYFLTPALATKINTTVMVPAVKAMEMEGRPYKGVLYGGLMIDNNEPKVLEFNCRFGDPECQVCLPRLKSDLAEILLGVVNDNLKGVKAEWSKDACVGVTLTSEGYPGTYRTGFPISGLDSLDKDVVVFHGGTKQGTRPGEILTSGGRVMTVVATGKTLAEAREKIYSNIKRIQFEGAFYRKDIARF